MTGRPEIWARGLRVLVVEDNPLTQRAMSLLLRSYGIDMTLAADGLEAVELWPDGAWDAVLMDCQMPRMDGFAATRELRRLEREADAAPTPIIALTAGAFASDRRACLDAGMDDYLTKPLQGKVLLETLARHVGVAVPAPEPT